MDDGEEITTCYLIELCRLCGTDPPRGVCIPKKNVSRCECFVNTADPSSPYTGEFCYPQRIETTNRSTSTSSWPMIVVGILAGLVVLLASVTTCLLYMARRRRRRQPPQANP